MEVRLEKALEASVKGGHPWVFADALRPFERSVPAGTVVDLLDRRGEFLARGTLDPASPIAFRCWTLDRSEVIDEALVERRLRRALALRRQLVQPEVTGFRVCHGENDFLPGLVCDLYDDVASVSTDGAAGLFRQDAFCRAVERVVQPRAIAVRNRGISGGAGAIWSGDLSARPCFSEGTRSFWVDVLSGQKTGFFLDQRENRTTVGSVAVGKRVLNTFCYTGGFSVAAALSGAAHVTSVDVSAPAIAVARENFSLNGLVPDQHTFLAADAFAVLEEAAASPGRYDLIVLDPPSFAKNQRSLGGALEAYTKLNEAALRALPSSGWLATSSCSSHVTPEAFGAMLSRAAERAGRRARVVNTAGAAACHPVRLGFPEGRYLKFSLLYVERLQRPER